MVARENLKLKLIAIETSSTICSVALNVDGKIDDRSRDVPRGHARHVLPLLDDLLQAHQLQLKQIEVIAFGRGPGSFTGVRIACAVTQGIAYGLNIPVIAISSLAAMAQTTQGQYIYSVLDARMGEIYCAAYKRDSQGIVHRLGEEQLTLPEDSRVVANETWVGVGSGWVTYAQVLRRRLGDDILRVDEQGYPNARGVAELAKLAWEKAKFVSAAQAQPTYLRDKVADKPSRLNS